MKIISVADRTETKKRGREFLDFFLADNSNSSVLLLLSGGSAFDLIDGFNSTKLGPNLTISVLDERYVFDSDLSNFAQMAKTEFYRLALTAGANFIDPRPRPNQSLSQAAVSFDQSLKRWRKLNPAGRVIITQGIGFDGHTAGIMPFPENKILFKHLFEDPAIWAVGYDAAGKNELPLRLTCSISFLENFVDQSLGYVLGEEKRDIFERVQGGAGVLADLPALVFNRMKKVEIFTDLNFD
ncbi:MAG: 6-phosphogluconolactonase [Patescibacteria group bacterium]|nr:6-phosphogluconolactonase [Patescibacteria group bacterium]MCL5257980.1 6-phosphogluconolactonase [Patescibacteria group bacterium]